MTLDELRSLLRDNPDLRVSDFENGTVTAPATYTTTIPGATEHYEQSAVIAWAEEHAEQWPELELLYSIPNGGYRHPKTAATMKAEGQRPGIPDLCLPVGRQMSDGTRYNALYVEMKRKGGKASDSQLDMIRKLQAYGNLAVICYGAQDAIDTLEFYLRERNA